MKWLRCGYLNEVDAEKFWIKVDVTSMEMVSVIKVFFWFGLLVILCLSGYLLVEAIRTMMMVRKLLNRVEFITDLKSWLDLVKRFPRKRKSSRA